MRWPLILLLPLSLSASHLTVHLKDPEYRNGTFSTERGGVLLTPEIRIQARHITYINKWEGGEFIYRLQAHGDLMVNIGENSYIGRELEYDFATKRGTIRQGIANIDFWFLGGEMIELNPDRSFLIHNAFITTSESEKMEWKIKADKLAVTNEGIVTGKKISFSLFDYPIFWLPCFESNLKYLPIPPVRYYFDWRKSGPQIGMRYRVYSDEQTQCFFRLNLSPPKGIGGALEATYTSASEQMAFSVKNYLDHALLYWQDRSERAHHHYRFQGDFRAADRRKFTLLHITYDRTSDQYMHTDFTGHDREKSAIGQTGCRIRAFRKQMIFGVDTRFRVNSFASFKEELPAIFWAPTPLPLKNSGLLLQNRIQIAHLHYPIARGIASPFSDGRTDFHSTRFSAQHALYRSFSHRGFTLAPLIGLHAIFYSKNRRGDPAKQLLFTDECSLKLSLKNSYAHCRHILQPYVRHRGITRPTVSPDTLYIFDNRDGHSRLNALQVGVRNLLYLKGNSLFDPNFTFDICAYGFFGTDRYKTLFPRLRGTFIWKTASFTMKDQLTWNREQKTLDSIHARIAWTIDAKSALSMEFRHRGRFDWRCCDPDDLSMRLTRPFSELNHSPLSDRRNTFSTRLQMQLTPQWTARVESHTGWGREGELPYHKVKVQLIAVIATSWRCKATFTHTPTPQKGGNQFTLSFSLAKK